MVFANLSVLENLRMGAYLRADKVGIAKDLEYVFGMFPRLREREWQSAGTLSGGEQQMLAIGRALMSKPKCLTMSLSSSAAEKIRGASSARVIAKACWNLVQICESMSAAWGLNWISAHCSSCARRRSKAMARGIRTAREFIVPVPRTHRGLEPLLPGCAPGNAGASGSPVRTNMVTREVLPGPHGCARTDR